MMDYSAIAVNLLEEMHGFGKMRGQVNVFNHLQGEMIILAIIAANENETKPSWISREMNVSSARVATALNNLEDKGLIIRRIDQDDRRQILVELTPEGKTLFKVQKKFMECQIVKLLKQLGEHDAEELLRIVKKVAEIIRSYNFNGN